MRADADPPSEVSDRIIGACLPGVANTLERVSCDRTERSRAVARSHIDRIGGVAKVMDASAGT